MKRILFFLLLNCSALLVSHTVGAQETVEQKTVKQILAEMRMENRKSNDPIYEVGDTLYLFYDFTDSLQEYGSGPRSRLVRWKLRELTPLEGEDAQYWDLWGFNPLALECTLFPVDGRSPRILSKAEVAKLPLTSRKEFMDFYLRELKRQQKKWGELINKRKIRTLSGFHFSVYFSEAYMLIPMADGSFELYLTG